MELELPWNLKRKEKIQKLKNPETVIGFNIRFRISLVANIGKPKREFRKDVYQ